MNYQRKNKLKITYKKPNYKSGFYPILFSYIGNKYENGKRVFNIPLSVPFKKIFRGLGLDTDYLKQSKDGKMLNADINGALNIYRKSSVCNMNVISYLLRRGVSTPRRLQVI